MSLTISLTALEKGRVTLEGELPPSDLDLDMRDPCVQAHSGVLYAVTAERVGDEVSVEGWLETRLQCLCVRCLKAFEQDLRLDPWICLLALKGEEAAPMVMEAVDLTPQLREDMLLSLPPHPVCGPDCQGMAAASRSPGSSSSSSESARRVSPAWSVLDTLKLDE